MTWCEKADAVDTAETKLEAALEALGDVDEADEVTGIIEEALDALKRIQSEINRKADEEYDEEQSAMEREYWSMVI